MANYNTKHTNIINLSIANNGTDFIGIKITPEKKELVFPMGYHLLKKELDTNQIEKNERKQIFNLIRIITSFSNHNKGEITSKLNGKQLNDFPVKAILFLIEDYLERNSYYTEKEILYIKNTSGKINWQRTIKKSKPVVSENGIAFLNFIIRKNRIQENQLITELHKYCVYKSFEIFGFLYTSFLPERGLLDEKEVSKNLKYFKQFLKDKIDSTNIESNIELFKNMFDFLNNLVCEDEIKEAVYGTNCFQTVWEKMIDNYWGTIKQYQKEKYFYPASKWNFLDGTTKINHPLRPDTILLESGQCFIIDAKYYSYTMLRELILEDEDEQQSILIHGSIPGTDSIQKQITYAQYLDKDIKTYNYEKREKYRFHHKDIYNVFLIPSENTSNKIEYIGNGISYWHDGSKNYHKIHIISVDTKFLIENYKLSNDKEKKELIDIIKKYGN